MLNPSPALSLFAILIAIAPLTSCANSSGGQSLEQLLAPDPQLQQPPASQPSPQASVPPAPVAAVSLPDNFPSAIPQYPNATLELVSPLTSAQEGLITRWFSPDSTTVVRRYYQQQFTENNWEMTSAQDAPELSARREDLQLTLSFAPPTSGQTTYTLTYRIETIENTPTVISSPSPSPSPTPSQVSTPLSPEVKQLIALGITNDISVEAFQPNEIITRREYARWLINANNQIYADDPGKQIRLASGTGEPVFQDVPKSDPDFAYIQGLAEAGLIPSALTGEATETRFRPDAPLTRENLIGWKVPLDTRSALPKATIEAVKDTWGFQDTSKINAQVLPSILVDFQNGNNANIRRVFGYTRLFQPQKTVTQLEAATALTYFGTQGEGRSIHTIDRE
ncbi:S-layer homology domain-containing protein [Roseofilum sp. BLCC_M91]|uniref:S-layer homology domain-containing protein n=1 Tax=Roseofilum halophilum BLCC-M91 TaxID=3022259 RepID=A0ABT7BK63_9CYAN|nr:S-layer homology domain-containing protein [Roseofilum halophilum]MDJ1179551.1 S-layer homology domain-containing protein [Roseofilum halophilum BLCC-M91]